MYFIEKIGTAACQNRLSGDIIATIHRIQRGRIRLYKQKLTRQGAEKLPSYPNYQERSENAGNGI